MEKIIRQKAHIYLRHGGKKSRRANVSRLIRACHNIAQHERVSHPSQISKRMIHEFYNRLISDGISKRTIMDYYYAFVLMYELFSRLGKPPKLNS